MRSSFVGELTARLLPSLQAATPALRLAPPGQADPGKIETKPAEASAVKPEGIVIPVFPAPEYYLSNKLSPPPKLLDAPEPVFPDAADAAGVQVGSVVLRLRINEQGLVDEAMVMRSTPAGVFDQAAIDAFSKAKFSPGRLLGIAVKSQVSIEVQFAKVTPGESNATRGY